MSVFEIITVLLSAMAIGISAYAIWGQQRLQRESNEMQRATAQLAKKQLELLAQENEASHKAHISLDLIKEGRTSFRFVITNIGSADARNVNLELLLNKPSDNPLIESEVKSKLPAPKLTPGNSLSLIAALHMGSPRAYRAKLIWENPDGTKGEDETFVSL